MTSEALEKANELESKISELESFIYVAERRGEGTIVNRKVIEEKYFLRLKKRGCVEDRDFDIHYGDKLWKEILNLLRTRLKDLKKQLEEL